uniref:Uncharacterized protein n=1 Tax=Rhizophora mucronata TaxID=61149 RepID=A0A2P2N5Q0_RHIMU
MISPLLLRWHSNLDDLKEPMDCRSLSFSLFLFCLQP